MKVEVLPPVSRVLAFALCVGGCGVPKAAWIELKSQHFVLQTDAGETRGEELVRDLERSYAAVRSCVKPAGASDPPGVTHVVAFEDESDYEKVAPPRAAGYFLRRSNSIEAYSRIVFPANAELHAYSREELLQHELAHRFIAHYMPNVPTWLNEGLAEFLSTARLEGESVVMGDAPGEHWLSASGWMVDQAPLVHIAPDPAPLREATTGRLWGRGYIGAWMMVHVMVLGDPRHRQALENTMNDLRTSAASSEEAFAKHFDSAMLAEIDAAYRAFQTRTHTPMQTVPLDAPPEFDVVSRRTLSDVETIAAHGRGGSSTDEAPMLALQDANRAITSDPKSPEGYLLRASVLFDPKVRGAAVGDLRTALRLAPDDPRVRRGLAAAVLSQDGPTTEVKGLVEWVRERARVAEDYRLLARWELKTKHPERALEHAKRGVSADAWCVPCYELAADASLGMRDYDGAVRWQRQAVNVAAEHVTKGSLDRLTHFEKLKKSPLPAPEKPKRDAEADAIHDAIRARRPDFDVCYETGLARDPTLRGKVVVIFVVGADGSVMGANDAGSELRDTGVIECVVGLVRTMKFARPANGARAHRHRWGFPKKAREGAPNTEGAPPP